MALQLAAQRSLAGILALAAASLLVPDTARGNPPPTACRAWDIAYTLAANLKLTDTPLGQGNGVYRVGPGQLTLRFDDVAGKPAGEARLLAYRLREHFTVKTTTLFWTTSVTTNARTTASRRASGFVAHGRLVNHTLNWSLPLHGYRTDGTLTCDGSLCGKFGAPPAGTSQLHVPPHDVTFKPFKFSRDLSTFTMRYAFISKTEMPKHTAHLALAGRATHRMCIAR